MAASASDDSGELSLPRTLTLRGKRGMLLRTPSAEDDAGMCEIFSDPITMKHLPELHRSGGWTLEEMAGRRNSQARGQLEGTQMIVYIYLPAEKNGSAREGEEEDLVLAGTTGFTFLDLKTDTAEIGIILHHPYWRQGLATEAMFLCLLYGFETIELNRVDWCTSASNVDMRGWCETILQMKPYDLNFKTHGSGVGYSLLRSEWFGRVRHFLMERCHSGRAK